MPFFKDKLRRGDYDPVSFPKDGEAWEVDNISHGGCFIRESCIAIDGRCYHCAGTVWLPNGQTYRATFMLYTFKERPFDPTSVYLVLDDAFYELSEPKLLERLGTQIVPEVQLWSTDIPLCTEYVSPFPADSTVSELDGSMRSRFKRWRAARKVTTSR